MLAVSILMQRRPRTTIVMQVVVAVNGRRPLSGRLRRLRLVWRRVPQQLVDGDGQPHGALLAGLQDVGGRAYQVLE